MGIEFVPGLFKKEVSNKIFCSSIFFCRFMSPHLLLIPHKWFNRALLCIPAWRDYFVYGRDYKITDSTIEFKDKNKIIHYAQIGFIKTKHSFGHNIGVGSLLGVASLSLFSLMPSIQSDLFDKGTMVVLVSTLIGAPSGAFIGTISNIFKNIERVNINGDIEKWGKFRTSFLRISK
ncbi:MAG: hypothetical protein Q8R50_14275 [Sediminibacterium sp.]|nr:hypothetical protein [Sediminibacterium sp.]